MNEFWALQLDAKLTSLSLANFPTIEDFLMKFKYLHVVLQGCGKNKTDDECIFLILSKLRVQYHIFPLLSSPPWIPLVIGSGCLHLRNFVTS